MKKHYYSLLAAATMLLATTSCSQDEELVRPSGEMTTFKVELNGVANSRTAGDGQTVNKLYYAVYDKAGTKVIYPNGKSFEKADISEGKASVDIPLMKSEAYDIVFWAQNEESGAYTVTDLKTISVNYPTDGTLKSNKENRDAFFNSLNDFTANGETQTVYLKRPFAQLNVATTITDWNEAVRQYQANGGTDAPVKYSAVTISQLATDFNAKSGVAGGETSAEIIFNKAELLDESIWIKGKDDEGNETKSEYKLLAMNYLLMTSDKGPQDINEHEAATGDNSKATVDVDFTLWKDDANEIMTANVPFVPIQRNYRTNIIGEFLTGDKTQFNIVVDADFDGDHNVKPEITFDDEKKIVRVYNVAGLKYFRDLVNGTQSRATENKPDSYAGWTIFLEADMDLNNEEWEPIGAESAFQGTFDGKNHTISNFTINQPEKSGVGFIASLHGTVKNVKIDNATVTGMKNVGALVGSAIASNVTGCSVNSSNVTATVQEKDNGDDAGVLIGYIDGDGKDKFVVADNIVTNSTVTAYRDLGVLVGTANNKTIVKNNKVSDSKVIVDRTPDYKDVKDITIGEVVGNILTSTIEDNEAKNIGFEVIVDNETDFQKALGLNIENIVIKLADNVSFDIAAWKENAMGGESTKTITIDGSSEARSAENYTLTFKQTNSDWNNIVTNGAKLILNNLNITSTENGGNKAWNNYILMFACETELENVNFSWPIGVSDDSTLKNVKISYEGDYYAIYVKNMGGNFVIDGLQVEASRGIKVIEEYISEPQKVTLNISNSTFKTQKKAAVLVTSTVGADITWGEGNDISAVVADNFFAVWVDEDCAQYADLVTVNGVSKIVEGTETVGAEEPEKLNEAVSQENASVLLKPGTYTFPSKVAKGVTIECTEGVVFEGTSGLNINGATVIGARFSGTASGNSGTVAGTINGSFKNCTFEGVNALRYCYAGETVVFENCVFDGSVYGVHFDGGANEAIFKNCTFSGFNAFGAAITLLTLEDCTFKANGKSSYNGANLWGNTNLVRTNFVFDGTASTEWIGLNGAQSNKTISLTDCKVNDGNGSVFDYFANYTKKISDGVYQNMGYKVTVDNVVYVPVDGSTELNEAIACVQEGDIISLTQGEYVGHFDVTGKKALTLVSLDKQASIKGMLWADNCNVTVKGLTLTNPDGVQHPNPTNSQYFTTINNQYPLVGAYNNADIKFEDCTFDIVGPTVYGFYGYAHNSPVFEGCTFNCNKIRPIACNGPALTINGCTFNNQYHYAARIFENSGETQTVIFTNNIIQGSNDKGEFEGINISKKGNTATVLGNFTIKGNTNVKYRHHKNVTMSVNCTYDTDIANFAFEKED